MKDEGWRMEGGNQQPATSNQQPATSNQQPATSNQQPAISNQQSEVREVDRRRSNVESQVAGK
jgi:hypothetical protein